MSVYEDVINLALRRGLFFPASEIYNGPAGFYDYGPYGLAIRNRIVDVWRKELVQKCDFIEIDGAITVPESVLKASGHLANFSDPMTQCDKCHSLHRADQLLNDFTKSSDFKEVMKESELTNALREYSVKCPKCKGALSDVKRFNMVVRADIGAAAGKSCYLRPETCQSIFIDFARLARTCRVKLPQGISQFGKAFRNEISPRQSLLRQVEFYQMETEVFFNPAKINDVEDWDDVSKYKVWVQLSDEKEPKQRSCDELVKKNIVSGEVIAFYLARTQQFFEKLGFEKMRFRQLDGEERAFYAKEGWDFEVLTSLGWLELVANNYRTDYDLAGHQKGSNSNMEVMDDEKKVLPHVWEISIGVDRTFYAVLETHLRIKDNRVWLALPERVAPVDVSVFPLLSNKPELVKLAKQVANSLRDDFSVFFDDAGSIGKRYARMDEVGCPFCITIDFDSLEKNDVTVRFRDSTEQKRIKIVELAEFLRKKV